MKLLPILLILFLSNALAAGDNICPDISGVYHCSSTDPNDQNLYAKYIELNYQANGQAYFLMNEEKVLINTTAQAVMIEKKIIYYSTACDINKNLFRFAVLGKNGFIKDFVKTGENSLQIVNPKNQQVLKNCAKKHSL